MSAETTAADYYREQLASWQVMLTPSLAEEDPGLIVLIEKHVEHLQASITLMERIEAAFAERGFGLVLQNQSRYAYAIVLPDASVQGKFRYQTFDERGFSGHVTRESVTKVLLEAFSDGFTRIAGDQNILDTLAATETWAIGMAQVAHILLQNSSKVA